MENNTLALKTEKSSTYLEVAMEFLKSKYDLRFNIVLSRNEFKLKDDVSFSILEDRDVNSWWTSFHNSKLRISKQDLNKALNSDFVDKYDPFVSYFESLPEWSREFDYIEELANTVETTTPELWKKYLRKWLVAVVACAIDDTIANQTVLVLAGGQGIGKTTWLNALLPKSLSKYIYVGAIDPNNKDSKILLAECLLINLDELESTSKRDMSNLKSLITLSHVKERKAYRADSDQMIRKASFCGSVNDPLFLNDPTGTRRFLCNSALNINLNALIDMDKVYSQAFQLYKGGFIYHLTSEDQKELELNNSQFRLVPMEEEIIQEHFSHGIVDAPETLYMTTTEIMNRLANSGTDTIAIDNSTRNKLGVALRTLKFPRIKRGGYYVYVLKPIPNQVAQLLFGDVSQCEELKLAS